MIKDKISRKSLDPKKRYIFAMHPHGMLALGRVTLTMMPAVSSLALTHPSTHSPTQTSSPFIFSLFLLRYCLFVSFVYTSGFNFVCVCWGKEDACSVSKRSSTHSDWMERLLARNLCGCHVSYVLSRNPFHHSCNPFLHLLQFWVVLVALYCVHRSLYLLHIRWE
jgi:hypothetical protein